MTRVLVPTYGGLGANIDVGSESGSPFPCLIGDTQGGLATTQAAWYFDFSNVTGLANDLNSGLDASHPLLTWREFINRIGTPSAVWSVKPTLFWLSPQPNNSDPIVWAPVVPSTLGFATIIATPTVKVAAGLLTNGAAVVPKNRTVPANGQLTAVTMSGAAVGNTAPGDMLRNITKGCTAWVYANVAGNQFTLSQPLTSQDPTFPLLNEVDTWDAGDTVEIDTPPMFFVDALVGVVVLHAGLAPVGSLLTMNLNGSALLECRTFGPTTGVRTLTLSATNCDLNGGQFALNGFPQVFMSGGQTRTNAFVLGTRSAVTFDAILSTSGAPYYCAETSFIAAYLAVQTILRAGSCPYGPANGAIAGSPFTWGPGNIEVGGTAELQISSAAGAPQQQLLHQGGGVGCLTFAGVPQGVAFDPSVDPNLFHGPRNLTAVLLDTTIALGGFRQGAAGPICARGPLQAGTIRSGII